MLVSGSGTDLCICFEASVPLCLFYRLLSVSHGWMIWCMSLKEKHWVRMQPLWKQPLNVMKPSVLMSRPGLVSLFSLLCIFTFACKSAMCAEGTVCTESTCMQSATCMWLHGKSNFHAYGSNNTCGRLQPQSTLHTWHPWHTLCPLHTLQTHILILLLYVVISAC